MWVHLLHNISHKKLVLEIEYATTLILQISPFCQVYFVNFAPNLISKIIIPIFFGQLEIFSGE